MPYVTTIERRGEQRATLRELKASVLENLETRFGTVSEALEARIRSIEDANLLRTLRKRAILVASPAELEQGIAQPQ